MSQSPESIAASLADELQADRYRLGWKALTELIGQGRSFSGHEKNCCFLNTGGGRFADISAAAGLAFDDDGRAVAECDWDFDGRPDLWVANRTAPRVRLLRNAGMGGHWLALRLEGTTCNRDAIGARVVVTLPGGQQRTKSVRAGDGFLAQSSKWLHFGLGAVEAVEGVAVHWPGGEVERVDGVAIDSFQTIAQGTGTARPWKRPLVAPSALQPGPLPEPEAESGMRTWLIGRIPLPKVEGLLEVKGKPLLLNLWSNRCPLCLAELAEWTKEEATLLGAGLEILALNVDALLGEPAASAPPGFPFPAGEATPEIVEALEVFHRTFVELQQPLPVPVSFLLDSEGRVAAIYKGRIELGVLLADLELLGRGDANGRNAAVPFAGRWASNLFPLQPERLAEAYAAVGRTEWRDRYLADYGARFSDAGVQSRLGVSLVGEGKVQEAVAMFAKLFETAKDDHVRHREAGILLLQHNAVAPARSHLRTALPGFKDDPDFRFNLGLAEAGSGNAEAALENFHAVIARKPEDAAAHFQVANVLHATQRGREAVGYYREALRLRPGWVFPANNLAWLLSTHRDPSLRDGAEALKLIEPITVAEGGTNPVTLSTLAAAQAETRNFQSAIATATKALELATQAGAEREAQGIQAALREYRAARALRSR